MEMSGAPHRRSRPTLQSGTARVQSQPWTVSRCQRLLRPLLSHIASLRASKQFDALPQGPSVRQETMGAKRPAEDSSWLVPRKKVRRTYSQRRSRHSLGADEGAAKPREAAKSRPASTVRLGRSAPRRDGEIIPPTPLLRRARGHLLPSPIRGPGLVAEKRRAPRQNRQRVNADDLSSQPTGLQGCLILKPDAHGSGSRELEGICRSFEALIKATTEDAANLCRTKGPRSLLAMCLRGMPGYIAECEAWERMEAEENGTLSTINNLDTSRQIYHQMEALGSNQGWRHLRSIARADGIKAIGEAIMDGLLDDDVTRRLVYISLTSGASHEAAELVAAMTNNHMFPRPLAAGTCFGELPLMQPMSYLGEFSRVMTLHGFLLRQYNHLLSDARLPYEWLATRESESVWEAAVRSLSKDADATDAINFINTSVLLLAQRPPSKPSQCDSMGTEDDLRSASQQSLASILTILASMSILGEKELRTGEPDGTDTSRVNKIRRRLRYILQTCAVYYRRRKRGRTCVDNCLLLELTLFLSSTEGIQQDVLASKLESTLESISTQQSISNVQKSHRRERQCSLVSSLLSSMAQACSRGLGVPAHTCLDDLFERLEVIGLDETFAGTLKAASASQLAQETKNVRDLMYAERLNDKTMRKTLASSPRSREGGLFAGYRWEETIGEWVKVSPVAIRQTMKTRRSHHRSSSSDAHLGGDGCTGITLDVTDRLRLVSAAGLRRGLHPHSGEVGDSASDDGSCVDGMGSSTTPLIPKSPTTTAGVMRRHDYEPTKRGWSPNGVHHDKAAGVLTRADNEDEVRLEAKGTERGNIRTRSGRWNVNVRNTAAGSLPRYRASLPGSLGGCGFSSEDELGL